MIARQLASEMKKRKITKQRMAELMKTSRAQVDRLLDPDTGSATIEILQRAPPASPAANLGCSWCDTTVWRTRTKYRAGFIRNGRLRSANPPYAQSQFQLLGWTGPGVCKRLKC